MDGGLGHVEVIHVLLYNLDYDTTYLEIFESTLNKSNGFSEFGRRMAALLKSCLESGSGCEAV